MKVKRVKILHIANMNTDSGVACFLMNYIRNVDFAYFEMDFVCWNKREDNFYDEIKKLGGRIFTVTSYKKNPISFLGNIRAIVKNGNYDIIHGHEAIMSIPAFVFAKSIGVKTRIAHSHNSDMESQIKDFIVKMCRPVFKKVCTDYLACSSKAGSYLFGNQLFKDKGNVLHNAIDLENFKFSMELRRGMRGRLGLKDELVFGHVGRFNEQKNHEFLIDIFQEIYKRKADSKLVLIGEGEKLDQIKDEVMKKDLKDNVIFLGIQKNVSEWMQAMDVFLFPSLFEGLGIVLIEAQTSGLMCYCSSEVPEEADCGRLSYMSLSDSKVRWAEEILNGIIENRDNAYLQVREAGYDIITETKKLLKYYNEKVNQ